MDLPYLERCTAGSNGGNAFWSPIAPPNIQSAFILNAMPRSGITHSIKLDVFGRRMVALRTENAWSVFYLGSDGKRRPAIDVFVPSWVKESDLVEYLVDLCHEWASARYPDVTRLE